MATSLLSAIELTGNNYGFEHDPSLTPSPPSSPCSFSAIDSSPTSSPAMGTFEIDTSDEDEITVVEDGEEGWKSASPVPGADTHGRGKGKLDASPAHPYSASTRAIKRQPSYSKDSTRPKFKRHRVDLDPERGASGGPALVMASGLGFDAFERAHLNGFHQIDGYIHERLPGVAEMSDFEDREGVRGTSGWSHDLTTSTWDLAIAHAVDQVEGKIDLSGQGLTFIPPKISDLSNLVVFHQDSAPKARELGPLRSCSKSTNSILFGASSLGQREDEIHLFLAGNRISLLPNELFNLDALVVLSLRGNMLTEIPPLISQLRNLRELNVANNKLHYLPSEIMSLKLKSLGVDPNPFLENPYAKTDPGKGRWFGPVDKRHTVVPLAELALRALLAPEADSPDLQESALAALASRRHKTTLECRYELPLEEDDVPPPLRETLSSCFPGSIPSSQSPNATPFASPEAQRRHTGLAPRPCVSECPSHRHLDITDGEYRRPLFVAHAEERLSWEKEVAGQKVGGETGIPIRWRGCSVGCLDYLEELNNDGSVPLDGGDEDDWLMGLSGKDEGRVTVLRDDLDVPVVPSLDDLDLDM